MMSSIVVALLLGAFILTTGTVAMETNRLGNEDPTDVAAAIDCHCVASEEFPVYAKACGNQVGILQAGQQYRSADQSSAASKSPKFECPGTWTRLTVTEATTPLWTSAPRDGDFCECAPRDAALGAAELIQESQEANALAMPTARLISCLCQVESHCSRSIGCKWDRGSYSCGPYQIKKSYWEDASKQARQKLGGSWLGCTTGSNNMVCSEMAVRFYMARYAQRCSWPRIPTDEDFARIHNGGPNGCKARSTLYYWYNVKRCMARKAA